VVEAGRSEAAGVIADRVAAVNEPFADRKSRAGAAELDGAELAAERAERYE
jgi:hypothetical protein